MSVRSPNIAANRFVQRSDVAGAPGATKAHFRSTHSAKPASRKRWSAETVELRDLPIASDQSLIEPPGANLIASTRPSSPRSR